MKGRVILIDMPKERASQAALLVDGRLEDLLVDARKGDTAPAPGAIYWSKVDRLVPKIGGAFVKLTPDQSGFLREAKGLREGEGVLVQVISYAEAAKATPVTRRLLYKGRRIIHTPDAPGINVSRKIKDEAERQRLIDCVEAGARLWIEELGPKLGGFIVRTAARGEPADELASETESTVAKRVVCEMDSREMPPGKRALTTNVAFVTALMEWTEEPPDRLIVSAGHYRMIQSDDPGVEGSIPGEVVCFSSCLRDRAEPYDGADMFGDLGVRDEIDRLKSPRVDLPSGGWMAVEPTSAMVTVDVNTGGEFGGGAALTANLEAARELPRQLRLRGLGGQVTIDFAPLPKKDRRRIEDALKTSFRRDPIETTLAGWTPLGNFELQRKRERRPLREVLD